MKMKMVVMMMMVVVLMMMMLMTMMMMMVEPLLARKLLTLSAPGRTTPACLRSQLIFMILMTIIDFDDFEDQH